MAYHFKQFPFTYEETEWEEFEKRGFPEQEVKATWEKLFDTDWLQVVLKNGRVILKMLHFKVLLQESR